MLYRILVTAIGLLLAACSTEPDAAGVYSGSDAGRAAGGSPSDSNVSGGSAGTAGAGSAGSDGGGGTEGEGGGARLLPPEGQTLLVIGQDLESIRGYSEEVWSAPGAVTTYTRIDEQPPHLPGLRTPANDGAGDLHASELLTRYPQSALVIGLYLVDSTGSHLAHLADGTLDGAIDELGEFISEAERPVFLRIGYEFDGRWNHYEPEPYQAAFRHIVERLRQSGVDNFASVWQSATYALGTYRNLPIEAWYPGDDVVDWCGSSYFKFSAPHHQALIDFARAHAKPVMIAEAAAQGYDLAALTYSETGQTLVPKTADQIWDEWYGPFFGFVHQNADVIRAAAYINCNWAAQPMWGPSGGNGYWGDTRVEASPEIRDWWLSEIANPSWLHGSPELFESLQ